MAPLAAPAVTGQRTRGRLRALPLRVLRGVALALYALLLGELFVRVFCPQPVMPRYVTGTSYGVRANIPHAHYWHHTPEVDVEYRINGQGMRADHDYPLNKAPGTCRVAVFGDSLMMGYEVDLRDDFSSQLEQLLRARGYRAEVLNFAVSGFGTAEMLRTYEAFARQFHPDVVLFSWHVTDMEDNVRSGLYRLRDGQLESANATYLPGVRTQDLLMRSALYRLVADHSQLYSLIRERFGLFLKGLVVVARQDRASAKRAVSDDPDDPDHGDDDAVRAALRRANAALSSAIVAHAAQVVAADGKDFYLVEAPIRVSRTKFRSSVDALSSEVRSHLTIISPLAAFRGAARPDLKLYYEEGEGHLTPLGVHLLASEAAKVLAGAPHLVACSANTTTATTARVASAPAALKRR